MPYQRPMARQVAACLQELVCPHPRRMHWQGRVGKRQGPGGGAGRGIVRSARCASAPPRPPAARAIAAGCRHKQKGGPGMTMKLSKQKTHKKDTVSHATAFTTQWRSKP